MNKIIEGWAINLEQNKERKESIIKEFENTQIKLNYFNAIKHNVGWIGCLKSHLEIIRLAKFNNLDMVLVIEDDAYIENLEYFNTNFAIILKYLKKNKDKWNIFHGGPNINKHSIISKVHLAEPLLFDLSKCTLGTFVIYNANTYDFFLDFLKKEECKLKSSHKIDMLIYNKFNCITTYPCLIWQKEFFSNITQTIRTDFKVIKKSRDKIFKRLIKNINLEEQMIKKYLCIMLIIYSENNELYKYNKQIWKQYMNSNNNILALFVMYEPNIETEFKLIPEDNMLLIRGEENLSCENILNKTKIAIRYCNLNYSYDYIVRTNISSFWIFDNLVNFLKSNTKTNCIQGWKLYNKNKEYFISGTSIIIPHNLISLLLTHTNNEIKYEMDDVEISQYYMSNGIEIIDTLEENKNFMHLFKFSNLDSIKNKLKNIEKKLNDIVYFRVKNRVDREINDIYTIEKLLTLVYKKS
jgi:hypothetical protein